MRVAGVSSNTVGLPQCGRQPILAPCRHPQQRVLVGWAVSGDRSARPQNDEGPWSNTTPCVPYAADAGRRRRPAMHWRWPSTPRCSSRHVPVDAWRRSSREIVGGDRPSRRAISRTPTFCARQTAMSSPLHEPQVAARHRRGELGFTPTASRNHRVPTGDTPTAAASSDRSPHAIAARIRKRSCRHATVGGPGAGT
jgi:hypothetical protein